MGGPWRDRNYKITVEPVVAVPARSEYPSPSYLHAYLTGIALGALLGVVVLWLAIPYLPFAVGQ